MVEHRIDDDEQRLIALLALDHLQRFVEIEAIRLEVAGLHLGGVDKAADAGRFPGICFALRNAP